MEQKSAQQNDLEHFHHIVCTHEIAESVIPFAAIVAQDAQIGTSMEKQKDAQESTQQCHENLLGDGVNLW